MKKTLLLMMAAAATAACQPKGYTVKGDVQGVDGKVYLALMQGKTPQIIDSTVAVGGKFEFKGEIKTPMFAELQNVDKKAFLQFFIENSDINVSGSLERMDTTLVTGSKEMDTYKRVIGGLRNQEYADYYAFIDTVIQANPKSVAVSYIFFRQVVPSLDATKMREGVAKFDSSLTNIVYLKQVVERADVLDKVAIGQPFVDFEAADTTGKMVKLSDVAGKGKYVLLDFWASWCGPCRAENPNVVKDFKKFADKGFTVFGVSLDRNAEDWKKAIVKDELNWTNVSDLKFWQSAPAALYGVGSIPSNVLIDPNGVIVARNLRGEDLTAELEKIFDTKK